MRVILAMLLLLSLGCLSGCVGGSAYATDRGARGDVMLGRSF